eukprot:Opistho-2@64255
MAWSAASSSAAARCRPAHEKKPALRRAVKHSLRSAGSDADVAVVLARGHHGGRARALLDGGVGLIGRPVAAVGLGGPVGRGFLAGMLDVEEQGLPCTLR